jgi:hypothetical protein
MSKNRLVVADAGWAESIPEWLLDAIRAERMIYGLASILKPEKPTVGDAETVAYLMTASMRAPLTHDLAQIYFYLTAKLMERQGKELPDFLKDKLKQGLAPDEERELKDLKADIHRARGGDIDHPLLNAMREFKKRCDREAQRERATGQPTLI